jgi:hypothetical protein
LLTRQPHFVSAAGYVGPRFRVDHDISLIVPEVWSRMHIAERDPARMIEEGLLESCRAIENVPDAGRLGYRITDKFVGRYFGRVFAEPASLFTEEMLKPELQDRDAFLEGMNNIVETQRRVAQLYFEDDSVEDACPPLHALLHIMVHGHFRDQGLHSPELRALFDRDAFLESDWYRARLEAQAKVDARLWGRHLRALETFAANDIYAPDLERLHIAGRLTLARRRLADAQDAAYPKRLKGTLGVDPAVV